MRKILSPLNVSAFFIDERKYFQSFEVNVGSLIRRLPEQRPHQYGGKATHSSLYHSFS